MPEIAADPEAVRAEGRRWAELAERISTIRQDTQNLYLGLMAFFPGGMLTEPLLWRKYQDCLGEVVVRLRGAAIEYELVGITLRNIASDYEDEERVTADSFRVTGAEVERATEQHTPAPPGGAGPNTFE